MAGSPDLPKVDEQKTTERQKVEAAFASIKGLIKASCRPLPTQTGDESYITPTLSTGLLHDLGKLHIKDVKTLIQTIKTQATGQPTNDRTYLMEKVIQVAAELPSTSSLGDELTATFLNGLWNDLKHPPTVSLGSEYKYRSADGSNNNILMPKLGAAGTPYARTVRPQTVQWSALPAPETLFDCLMARKEFKPHPTKISSILFYLASIIIHDLFRTSHEDYNISMTSSYLDLAPLYGSNQDEQNIMRTFQDGKIKPDCFSEKRLLGFPPGVGVLLIMFNRFHNYVVEQLAIINEGRRFTKPKDTSGSAYKKYDNDLFQTGRLITCGLYINCVLKDYVRTILNLNRTSDPWDLDPRLSENKNALVTPAEEGIGNQVSAEFNLVYRWHAAISERDDKWTQAEYQKLFPGIDPHSISLKDLIEALTTWEANIPKDPQERPFANIKRGADGTLNDEALVGILRDSIEDVAGAFGARGVPPVLRSVEMLGIIQARSWNLCTLNEFRSFFGLAKYEKFEDINSDKEVADQLRHLYDHPDLVELYPGLVVEEAKEPIVPGSGLCPSFTVSRAVLSDAVALVRGDRFYTNDYTPKNLTSWGYNECNYDVTVDGGAVFYKLILRAFPQWFKPNSVYAHFPLVIPTENRKILTELLHMEKSYSFEPPAYVPLPTLLSSYKTATSILSNKIDYKVTWGDAITFLMQNNGKDYGYDFMLAGDAPANARSREMVGKALYRDNWYKEIKEFYEKTTLELLQRNSYKLAGVHQVDIVRDVGNLAQAHFAAEVFSLPMKTENCPHEPFADSELYMIMALVFTCIFFDADPAKSFPLRQGSRTVTQALGRIMQLKIEPISSSGFLAEIIDRFHKHTPLSDYGVHMITQLLKSGLGVKDVLWSHILPTAGGMVANQGQLFAQCLDFYLDKENKPHLKEINRLAKLDTKEADDLILRYFMEGSRLRASVGLYRDVATPSTIQDGSQTIHLHKGQRIMVDLVTASMDPAAFPHPEKVDLHRPLESYIHYGWGPHICLGYDASKLAMMTMLKTVAKLEGLVRAPGPQGELQKIKVPGGYTMYLTEDGSSYWPFPSCMKVQWKGDLPKVGK